MHRGPCSHDPHPGILKPKPQRILPSGAPALPMIRTYVSIRQIAICYIADIQYLVLVCFVSLYLVKIKVLID